MRTTLTFLLLAASLTGMCQNHYPPSGNVGIGTTNPTQALSVNGRVQAHNFIGEGLLLVPHNDGFNYTTNTGSNIFIDYYGFRWKEDPWTGNPNVGTYWGPTSMISSFGGMKFFTLNSLKMSLDPYGRLGLATGAPRALLDIADASDNNLKTVLARLSEGDGSGFGTYLGVRSGSTQPLNSSSFTLEHKFYGQLNSSISFHRGSSIQGGFLTFATNDGTERMRINPDGKVDIGTTTPGNYILAVNGDVAVRRLRVTQGASGQWPDYVFEPNYPLPSLDTLAAFILRNRHLPDVPSSSQVNKEGIDVVDQQATLLRKIEELTLYIIALKGEQDQQKQTAQQQQQRMLEQEKEIQRLKKAAQ